MEKITIDVDLKKLSRTLAWGGGLVAVVVVGIVLRSWYIDRDLDEAEQLMQKGFVYLATEALEGHRGHFVSSERGCRVLLRAYSSAKRFDRLQWATESCVKAHVDALEVYLSAAEVQLALGQDAAAFETLRNSEKFGSVSTFLSEVQILKKVHKEEDAANLAAEVARRNPDNSDFQLAALRVLVDTNHLQEAVPVAQRLKPFAIAGKAIAPVKAAVANILEKAGDAAGAGEVRAAPTFDPASVGRVGAPDAAAVAASTPMMGGPGGAGPEAPQPGGAPGMVAPGMGRPGMGGPGMGGPGMPAPGMAGPGALSPPPVSPVAQRPHPGAGGRPPRMPPGRPKAMGDRMRPAGQ